MSNNIYIGDVLDSKGRSHFVVTSNFDELPFQVKESLNGKFYVTTEKPSSFQLYFCNFDELHYFIIIAQSSKTCEQIARNVLDKRQIISFVFQIDASYGLADTFRRENMAKNMIVKKKYKTKLLHWVVGDSKAEQDSFCLFL